MNGTTHRQLHSSDNTPFPQRLIVRDSRYSEGLRVKRPRDSIGLATCLAFSYDQSPKDTLLYKHPLPPIDHPTSTTFRYYLWTYYRRLMLSCILINFSLLIITALGVITNSRSKARTASATATGANLTMAVLMRHEHFINVLFTIIAAIPSSTPLKLRRIFAKLAYNQGGVHAGCGISATVWYVYHVILVYTGSTTDKVLRIMLHVTSIPLAVILFAIVGSSHPAIRQRYHDIWELTHRYGGYVAVSIIWVQTIFTAIFQSSGPVGLTLVQTPNFWFLIIISCFIIHPWLYLRRVPIKATVLSDHATRLWFGHSNMAVARATRLTCNPAGDVHGFATIPNHDEVKGYSVVISHAGDFTRRLIRDAPDHIWVKGAPVTGVIRIATLFKPLVIVTTGSGIGPCLSFLQSYPDYPIRIIWSARSPLKTYGQEIMSSVLRSDSEAVIIDTKKTGHPDLSAWTYATYKDFQAEAIVIISNPRVTRDVVYDMESRKVPIFGAIFDS